MKRIGLVVAVVLAAAACDVAPRATPKKPVRRGLGLALYASPTGSGTTCSLAAPCSLTYALGASSPATPGDTVWLRDGTYNGTFMANLNGTASQPIVVRQYPNERAIINGGNSGGSAVFVISGSYTWFRDFEVMSSYGNRVSTQTGPWPSDILYGEGIIIYQSGSHPGLKFINMIVHDTRQGFSFWKEATDSETYGCLIYYNGWDAPDRGHGHGIYTQNLTGVRSIKDNIIFQNFNHGIQAYGSEAAFLNDIRAEGNTIAQNSALAGSNGRNFLLGGGVVANNPVVSSNYFYRRYDGLQPSSDFNMGGAGCSNPVVTNNYVADWAMFFDCASGLTMTGNIFYGSIYGFDPASYPGNTYYGQTRPTGIKTFVRPNQYEPGRGNVTVYNWDLASTVNVDLSSVLSVGSNYEVRNAQNFFGAPVLTGTYAGGSVSLPMTGLVSAAPVGLSAPAQTGPEFNVFVVRTVGGTPPPATTSIQTSTQTPTRTATPTAITATPTRTPTPMPSAATATRTPTSIPTPTPVLPPGQTRKTRTPSARLRG